MSQTTVFEAVKENKSVARKLAIFMLLEATIPIAVFFIARNIVAPRLVSPKKQTIFAAGVAILSVNLVIFFYIFYAVKEDQEEQTQEEKESKKQR